MPYNMYRNTITCCDAGTSGHSHLSKGHSAVLLSLFHPCKMAVVQIYAGVLGTNPNCTGDPDLGLK